MRVLVACSLGGAGHLNPLVPFADAARRRGDEVLVVGPPELEDMARRAGHAFRAGAAPPEADVAYIRDRLATAPRREASVLGNRELFGRLATEAMLPVMRRTCADWRPDLILREPCEYASAVAAGELGVPVAQVAISLAEAEDGSIADAAPALEAHRTGLVGELRASTYLTRFPESLDPSPFARTVRIGGPVPSSGRTLPAWWPGVGGPLVYLTLGTVVGHMAIATEAYRIVLDAVSRVEARVLLTIGRQMDRAALGAIPPNVHVEAWVDQGDVFGSASVVVCHGGSGTAFGALAAGVPLVIAPLFVDQFANAHRIAAAGAGLVVAADPGHDRDRRRIGVQDAQRLADAVRSVLGQSSFRREAARLAAEMAAAPTAEEALASLLPAG
jgi:UDP:flavonoid glycosyltransferase YjiC (YdhE family)